MAQTGVQIRKLRDIDTRGVALVKRGANKRKFAVAKNEGGMNISEALINVIKMDAPFDEEAMNKLCADAGVDAQACEAFKALVKISMAYKDQPEMLEMIKTQLPKLLGVGGQSQDVPGEQPAEAEGEPVAEDEIAEEEESEPGAEGETPPALATDKQKTKTKAPPFGAKKGNPMAKSAEELNAEKDVLAKSAADAIAKATELEAVIKSQGEVIKSVQVQLAKEQDERQLAVWVNKADKDLQFVPGKTAAQLGEMLFKTEKAIDKTAADAQFDMLKSTSEVIAKSALLTGSGSQSRGGKEGEKSAYELLQAKADGILEKSDIVKEGGSPDMMRAKAFSKAVELYPALYKQYLDENQAQVGNKRYAQ